MKQELHFSTQTNEFWDWKWIFHSHNKCKFDSDLNLKCFFQFIHCLQKFQDWSFDWLCEKKMLHDELKTETFDYCIEENRFKENFHIENNVVKWNYYLWKRVNNEQNFNNNRDIFRIFQKNSWHNANFIRSMNENQDFFER